MAELRRELLHRRTLSKTKQALADSHVLVDVFELATQLIHQHIQINSGVDGIGRVQATVFHAILTPPGQGIPREVGYHELRSGLPTQATTGDVGVHGKQKIL